MQTTSEESTDKEKAIQIALEKAEARFARELKSVTKRLRAEMEEERLSELRAQKTVGFHFLPQLVFTFNFFIEMAFL